MPGKIYERVDFAYESLLLEAMAVSANAVGEEIKLVSTTSFKWMRNGLPSFAVEKKESAIEVCGSWEHYDWLADKMAKYADVIAI